MKPTWQTKDGAVKLYHGDCLKILPGLKNISAIVTDPPYGIGYKGHLRNALEYKPIEGDDQPYDPAPILKLGVFTILWGANNFADRLPIGGWIVWDKRLTKAGDKMLGSPFELAWCSRRLTFKIIRVLHGGAKNADAPNGDVATQPRFHPTQKPVVVFAECIRLTTGIVLDPYLGSGSAGLAAVRLGRSMIGIEKDAEYFEIAVDRIKKELSKTRFVHPKNLSRNITREI